MSITFTKMHGLGNDYIYVDCFAQRLDGLDIPALSIAVSDRHRGVGSDGLILIAPPSPGVDAHVRMEMYNADGSRGEMCGNGIRCVAKYAVEHSLVPAIQNPRGPVALAAELNTAMGMLGETLAANEITATDVRVQTDRGVLDLVAFAANGIVRSVRVDMGESILEPSRIPVRAGSDRCVRQPLPVGGATYIMTCVSMGNPHAVFFIDDETNVDLPKIGPLIERHAAFPNRTNVHFARTISRQEARMRTWERGSGITQACGTGACAVLVAGVLEDRLSRRALLHLPGGDLDIEWSENGHVFMTGPAEEVFTGKWPT